jgi:uncharacterized delta-60 repeat protein
VHNSGIFLPVAVSPIQALYRLLNLLPQTSAISEVREIKGMRRRISFIGFQAQNLLRITSITIAFALAVSFSSDRLSVAVKAASGDLDESFGTQGRVVTRFFNNSQFGYGDRAQARALAIQTDGKIIAAGYARVQDTSTGFAVARYNPDGSLDSSFGVGGKITTRLSENDKAYAVALQPDGKIVVAGTAYIGPSPHSANYGFALVRYNPDGSLDSSFDGDGKLITDFFDSLDEASGVLVQRDGKIVAAGFATNGPNNGTTYEFAMVRYNPDGSLDPTFDGDGKVLTDFFGSGDRAYGALLQPDDRIVLAGVCYSASSSADFALARYNPDGSLDSSFDGDGKVNTPFVSNYEEYAASLALTPDNRIVAGGWANNNSSFQGGKPDFAVARYQPDGSLDNSFDGDGRFTLDFDGINDYDQAYSVAVQADGKIIAVGYAKSLDGNPNGTHTDFAILRLNPNGTLDSSFGNNGRVWTDFGIFNPPAGLTGDTAYGVKIQPDGKFVVAGEVSFHEGLSLFGVARYEGDAATATISAQSQSFTAAGGNDSVSVSGTGSWTAASNAPWVTIQAGASGSGNGSVSYTVASHSGTSPRSATMTIAGQTFTVYQGIAFSDVPPSHSFHNEIGKLSARGITLGCGNGNFCPDAVVTREQMAAFILKAKGEFNPTTPGSQRFLDVPPGNPFYAFIERMAVLQITSGCGDGNYCPTAPVLREQMAAFLIRALHEPGYIPPAPGSQRFMDVPMQSGFCGHIEEMALRNITHGCSTNPSMYCPGDVVTRAQMAAFLIRTFHL